MPLLTLFFAILVSIVRFLSAMNCPFVFFLFKKFVFILRMVQLEVSLSLSILYPLFSSDYVAPVVLGTILLLLLDTTSYHWDPGT